MKESKFNLLNSLFGIFVLLVSAGVFVYTSQPTVAFWDCGEYAACSAILGVPHPPGNPLFIIIGRVVTMLFSFIPSVAYRLNIFSAVTSGLAIMVLYFISVKSIKLFLTKKADINMSSSILTFLASTSGALFVAFSSTWWFNSVESEVYSVSMLFMALEALFTLKWYENKEDPKSIRFLYFVIYLAVLGVGVHLYTMMALPPIILFYVMVERKKLFDWKFLGTSLIIGYIIVAPKPFIWGSAILLAVLPFVVIGKSAIGKIISAAIAFSAFALFLFGKIPINGSDFSDTGFLIITGIALAIAISAIRDTTREKLNYNRWGFIFGLIALSAVGYSAQAFIPLRAMAHPAINENDPETWESFKGFIERKQYGDESMLKKMFHRQGSLINQFGLHSRMGFTGFFINEFGKKTVSIGPLKLNILFLVPGLFGFLGLFAFAKKEKNVWILISTLFIISSLGLILYMNFSDGTRGVRLEVRDRDYFWTPAFMYFGTLIAMGIFVLLNDLKKAIPKFGLIATATILALLPFATLYANYDSHTRHNNFFSHDYAYNLLNSCEKNGILFTNGDNDTFPLWYLQEAEKVRTDVIVANLSLINTPWYIEELLRRGLPTTFSKDEIKKLRPTQGISKPTSITLSNANIDVTIPKKPYFRVQDRMVLNIVDANKWKRPIYFAITVGNDNYMGLDPFMKMEAMVYRVTNKHVKIKGNIKRSMKLLNKTYKYRGLEKGSKVKPMAEDKKLVTNYAAMFIMIAQETLSKYFKVKENIDIINKNLNDSTVLMSYTKNEIDSIKTLKKSYQKDIVYYKKTIKQILKDGKKKISRTNMFDKYTPEFLNAIGDNDKAIKELEKKIKTSKDNNLHRKFLTMVVQKSIDDLLDDDAKDKAIKTVSNEIKMFPNDLIITAIAADYYEKINFYSDAITEYNKLLNASDNKGEINTIKTKIAMLKKKLK